MDRYRFGRLAALAAGLAATVGSGAAETAPTATPRAACEVRSGARTAALVELYTSEGCSSCPPADRLLGRLPEALAPGALAVPLALHVSYWDAIGWKDPYAQPVFNQRQRQLVGANGGHTSYTPHFFVGGRELRDGAPSLATTVQAVNATPAAADIRIAAAPTPAGGLALAVDASLRPSRDAGTDASAAAPETASLYLAVTEGGLVSRVLRGENSGATLGHEAVAREWIGPIAFAGGRTATLRREIALPAGWNRARIGVVAFVQDERSGRVLQALSAARCAVPEQPS